MSDPINASLQSALTELEIQRKEVSGVRIKSYSFIAAGIGLAIIGFLFPGLLIAAAIGGLALLITGIVFLSKATDKFNSYRHEFKQRIIAAALKTIDQSLELEYHSGLSEQAFINSRLFAQQPDRYSSQDQIYGSAGKTRFSFSEVHAEYKTVTQTKNGRQEHWHTILKGIVFCADFNKNFHGLTLIKPKDIGSALGAWITDKIPLFSTSGKELVKLENPDFDKTFVTWSSDQVEARYILTPAMMEKLCELDSRCRYTISASFTDSCMYIAFPLDKDYFEPPVFKSLLDQTTLNEDISLIRFMYNIIHQLDLNTRIWGKE
ncbi:DUF3137 domain-containing protein [Pedobacter metabolipauper]|uniref:Uncharacterized protein DUF3137 n=1 Tax=Pedobacter metabolipauper TaxID=425513 RepID=A0A4V3D157_9SPHI|nr:DUF3137 domain-containing protein [Pedobacter metabolipauper]TDQ09387.1 uncharacterized protein DUF3137 [Pedobacter metabolipauper]